MLKPIRSILLMSALSVILAGCGGQWGLSPATPTVDPDIYNQVPETTVFEPGECMVVLDAAVPAYTSSTLGGQSSGEVPAGSYEVGVAADYGSSLWYHLSGVGETNYINSASVASTTEGCSN